MTRRSLWTGVRRGFVATVTVAVFLAFGAGPAQAAAWSLRDGFESSAAEATWSFQHDGNGWGRIETDAARANAGTHYALVTAAGGSGTYSGVGRTVHPPNARQSCVARVALFPETWGHDLHVRVNLEVINPTDWTYRTLKHIDMDTSFNARYTVFSTDAWVIGPRDVVVRISALGATSNINVRVDDLRVSCTDAI